MKYKYLPIVNWVKKGIEDKTFKAGDKLPTEDELIKKFSCGRYTARQAISALEEEGLVNRIQGSGSYIAPSEVENETQQNSSNIIGVIIRNNRVHIFPEVFRGISEQLSSHGYLMNIFITDNDYIKERQAIENVLAMNPAGIILEPAGSPLVPYNQPIYEELSKKIPLISFHGRVSDNTPYIPLQGRKGTQKLARYLIDHGHTKIGSLYCMDEYTVISRYMGFKDEMAANGLEISEENTLWIRRNLLSDIFSDNGNLAVDRMIKNVSAVICHDDRIAYELIKYLHSKNIRVPEDISVVGYDNADIFTDTDIRLTTIAHPKAKYGENVANGILELINDPDAFSISKYAVEPELIEGNSVSCMDQHSI